MPETPKPDPATAETPLNPHSTAVGTHGAGGTGKVSDSPAGHDTGEETAPPSRKGKGGKPGRSGPPKGNTNGIRHGLKAGKLPPDAKYIEVRLNIVRRNLEQAVLDAKGGISLPDAAAIQTAIRWERHAALAQRWLTKQYDELKPADRLTFSREIARASGERDKAIAALKLDRDVKDNVLETLYARLPGPTEGDHE